MSAARDHFILCEVNALLMRQWKVPEEERPPKKMFKFDQLNSVSTSVIMPKYAPEITEIFCSVILWIFLHFHHIHL